MTREQESPAFGPPPFLQGRYRLVRQIGKGGMGLVYLAEDERLGRQVAIKFLAPDKINNSPRFFREARVVAQLSHPHIMALYDAGQEQSWHYLILEHLDGQNLYQRLKREKGGLPPIEVLTITRQILQALAYAHDAGIIHRDIKPENIMIMGNSFVKVTDFGLALAATETRITSENVLMGTALYLAPEMIQGQPATAQSDLYAVGVVLYEMLTGEPPYKGNNAASTLIEILNTAVPPPSLLKESISKEWDDLILTLLAKQPENRLQTAQLALAALPDISPEKEAEADTTEMGFHESTAIAIEAERQRLANLLQREIMEPLNLLLAQAGMYDQGLGANPQARTAVSVLTTLARQVMQQARDLETNLHPTLLESLGLASALEAFASQVERKHGIQVSLRLPPLTERMPRLMELAIFRATQEAAEAAIHDGRASAISIHMQVHDAVNTYTVEDNRQSVVSDSLIPATLGLIRQLGGQAETDIADGSHRLKLRFGQPATRQPTPRELDVLHCLVGGMSNKEIAQALNIKPRTVNFHLDNIYTKLHVNSRTEAAMVALRQGWVSDPV